MKALAAVKEAKATGAKFYLGASCARAGHNGLRYTVSGACVACNREALRRKRAADPLAKRQETYAWRKKNPTAYRAINRRSKRKYAVRRRREDVASRIKHVLRCRLGKMVRGQCRVSAVRHLGCTVEDLRKHLESRFQPGMTWENYGLGVGLWQIDHVIPLSAFDLTQEAQAKRAVHFSNLQPLWWFQNIAKRERDKSVPRMIS